ncbi:MAG TPA: AraC family transcriptional regulator [Roseiarcus sp.]|nr:AraC family transcriptional regulator [Roseiarcus sp.]
MDLGGRIFEGLERSCEGGAEKIISAPAFPGIERIEARFFGAAFEPHRHDTYAIGVTLGGVQTFHYRGARRVSLPGEIIVLHPDETHDGGAGNDEGLRYRMLYLEPSLLRQGLGDEYAGLPFVDRPVLTDDAFRNALLSTLGALDESLDELLADDLVAEIARALARHAKRPLKPLRKPAWRAANLARDYLEANATRPVRSAELETISGLDRFALSRHFRAAFATSPHRFLLMRRLAHARRLIAKGDPLAEIAAAAGFADQSHLTRQFKRAFGMTPGRWAALVAAGAARSDRRAA